MHRVRGVALLAAAFQAARIDTVFTLSGNHVMSVFDALIGRPVRLIHTRHEAAAVHMADAFACVSGTVGVALVTGGPGHVNAFGALCARSGRAILRRLD
jgi:acetolactate synthase-1/2/3 large subunit